MATSCLMEVVPPSLPQSITDVTVRLLEINSLISIMQGTDGQLQPPCFSYEGTKKLVQTVQHYHHTISGLSWSPTPQQESHFGLARTHMRNGAASIVSSLCTRAEPPYLALAIRNEAALMFTCVLMLTAGVPSGVWPADNEEDANQVLSSLSLALEWCLTCGSAEGSPMDAFRLKLWETLIKMFLDDIGVWGTVSLGKRDVFVLTPAQLLLSGRAFCAMGQLVSGQSLPADILAMIADAICLYTEVRCRLEACRTAATATATVSMSGPFLPHLCMLLIGKTDLPATLPTMKLRCMMTVIMEDHTFQFHPSFSSVGMMDYAAAEGRTLPASLGRYRRGLLKLPIKKQDIVSAMDRSLKPSSWFPALGSAADKDNTVSWSFSSLNLIKQDVLAMQIRQREKLPVSQGSERRSLSLLQSILLRFNCLPPSPFIKLVAEYECLLRAVCRSTAHTKSETDPLSTAVALQVILRCTPSPGAETQQCISLLSSVHKMAAFVPPENPCSLGLCQLIADTCVQLLAQLVPQVLVDDKEKRSQTDYAAAVGMLLTNACGGHKRRDLIAYVMAVSGMSNELTVCTKHSHPPGFKGVLGVVLDLLRSDEGDEKSLCVPLQPLQGDAWRVFASSRCPMVGRCCSWMCKEFSGCHESTLRTYLCSGCRVVRFCSRACKQAAWDNGQHRMCTQQGS